ncbi:MAG: hypothetical protein KZQ56_12050 [gamma proteobacterium symbiont of Lucinoma myriamae]|nr:hypothetical protein [gamma proteobacterium symbiont of Lucinoma myriamae]
MERSINKGILSQKPIMYIAGTEEDIGHTASSMVPLAQTMKKQIKEIKDWSFERAVSSSGN